MFKIRDVNTGILNYLEVMQHYQYQEQLDDLKYVFHYWTCLKYMLVIIFNFFDAAFLMNRKNIIHFPLSQN